MPATQLRVLLAVDDLKLAAELAAPIRAQSQPEIIVVEARGEAALKAARLLHPDLVILSGALRGTLDVVALSAALQAYHGTPVPVLLVTSPADLPDLLALHLQSLPTRSEADAARSLDKFPDASVEETDT
jgi:DNA-binding NarL/FixJ family response regulator